MISDGYNAGTAEQRAMDINNMFQNEDIKAIFCTSGGYTSNTALPYLNFELIKKNPKIFCGFSDITAINLPITLETGLVTFGGPTILPTLGDFGGTLELTLDHLNKVFFISKQIGQIKSRSYFSKESLWWDRDDTKPRKRSLSEPFVYLNHGIAEGILVGGNLETLCMLPEKYFQFSEKVIWFFEEEGGSTPMIERQLACLDQKGAFNNCIGILFAKSCNFKDLNQFRSLNTILSNFGKKYTLPVVSNLNIGHTNPLVTMQIGINAYINTFNNEVKITESAVN